jgi:ribosomal protein L12E/L44/L45/RPP1/RPP2
MLTRLAQEKMFDVLMALEIDPEDIDATKLFRAIADMNRSAVVAKKYAAEVKSRAVAAAASVAAKLTEAGKKGMSAEVAAAIRREILGIA